MNKVAVFVTNAARLVAALAVYLGTTATANVLELALRAIGSQPARVRPSTETD